MLFKSIRNIMGATALALLATVSMSNSAFAQKGGTGVMVGEVTWPTSFNFGAGAMANDNWQGSGSFNPGDGTQYTQSHGLAAPEFHVNMEIPVASNMMFAPRIAYNTYSAQWDKGATTSDPLVVSYSAIGADLLLKYAFNNFHVMGGGNVSTPVKATYAHSARIEDAVDASTEIPDKSGIIASLKGGLGYDIPLNGANSIWLTPEAFYTYPITNLTQTKNGSELFITTISGGASVKFALPTTPEIR